MNVEQFLAHIAYICDKDKHYSRWLYVTKFVPFALDVRAYCQARTGSTVADNLKSYFGAWGMTPNPHLIGCDIERVLSSRTGNCVELSILVVLLGKHLGFRAQPLKLPNHMLVRIWQDDGYVNFEPGCAGWYLADLHYFNMYRVSHLQLENRLYLTPLSDEATLAEITHKVFFGSVIHGDPIEPKRRKILRNALLDCPTAELNNTIGVNYLRRGKYRWAEKRFCRALQIDRTFRGAKNNLAEVLISQQRFQSALELLETMTEQESDPDLHMRQLRFMNRGRIYCRLGDYSRARAEFTKLLELHVSQPSEQSRDVHAYMACLSYFEGHFAESAQWSLAWFNNESKNELGIIWAASAYRRAGMQTMAADIVHGSRFSDDYNRDLGHLIVGEIEGQKLLVAYPEKRPETECYWGEFVASEDISGATEHWYSAMSFSNVRTFEHFRASRNFKDNCPIA